MDRSFKFYTDRGDILKNRGSKWKLGLLFFKRSKLRLLFFKWIKNASHCFSAFGCFVKFFVKVNISNLTYPSQISLTQLGYVPNPARICP